MNRKQRRAHALRRARSWLIPTNKISAEQGERRVAGAWLDGYDAGVRAERKKHPRPVHAVILVDDGQDSNEAYWA